MLRKTYNLTSLRVPAMECGRNEAIPKIGRLLRPIAQILAGARKDVSLFCVSPVIKEKSILIVTEEDMIKKGASISFAIEDERLRFKLKRSALSAAGLIPSEGLLKLAIQY